MTATIQSALDLLQPAKETLADHRGLLGIDGFIDRIIRVVEQRTDEGATFYESIPAFGDRVLRAAGKSACIEFHVEQTKIGGNGPIMANAIARLGLTTTYLGAVGEGTVDPVFKPLEQVAAVLPVCEAASTDALEFDDGKLMLQKLASLEGLNYDRIVSSVGQDKLAQIFEDSDFVALTNWSSLPHMSNVWQGLLTNICPGLSDKRRQLFFDLADPEKRHHDDVTAALDLVCRFQMWYNVILGLNEKESEHIAETLGCIATEGDQKTRCRKRACAIREKLGISTVVVHPTAFAVAATAQDSAIVDGPYTPKPLISTGAGDHFNAGFCIGMILQGSLEQCLQIGVATSGYYVRKAATPKHPDLVSFLQELARNRG